MRNPTRDEINIFIKLFFLENKKKQKTQKITKTLPKRMSDTRGCIEAK